MIRRFRYRRIDPPQPRGGRLQWEWWRPRIIHVDEWPANTPAVIREDPVWQQELREHGCAHVAAMLDRDRRREAR